MSENKRKFICPHCDVTLKMESSLDPITIKEISYVLCPTCSCRGPKGDNAMQALDNWYDMVGYKYIAVFE